MFHPKLVTCWKQVQNTPKQPCYYWPRWHRNWFWIEKAKVYLFFLLYFLICLAFNWFWRNKYEPVREAIVRTLLSVFLSVCVCHSSVEILPYYRINSTRTSYVKVPSYVKVRIYACIQQRHAYAGFSVSSCATCFMHLIIVVVMCSLLFSKVYGIGDSSLPGYCFCCCCSHSDQEARGDRKANGLLS